MNRRLFVLVAFGLSMVRPGSLLAGQASDIEVRVLYDNYVGEKGIAGLASDWGFACLITGTEKVVLFDAGTKGPLLLENMKRLNVRPSSIEAAVISHNHTDHTGGLISVLEQNGKIALFLPPSCPPSLVEKAEGFGAKAVVVTKPIEVCRGAFVIGPTGDKIIEQGLVLDTKQGLVLVTGCCHPGVVEMVRRAKEELKRDVWMVCGGFHLLQMSEADLKNVLAQLKKLGVRRVGPTHCTGDKAMALFKEAFGDNCVRMGVGSVLKY